MKIDKISLFNYKQFKGECTISELTKNLCDNKNIILLGGLNGYGKTNFFKAILLCLYGKNNKTLWPSRGAQNEEYKSYITSSINRQIKNSEPVPKMWIEISLKDLEKAGDLDDSSMSIKRSWKMVDNDIEGHFELFDAQGKPLETIPGASWGNYIEEIIPYEIHQFFFFDGEDIQNFIKDEDEYLHNSLSTVLGIKRYKRLKEDLEKTKKVIISEVTKGKQLGVEISEKRTELEKIELKIDNKKNEIDNKKERIGIIDTDIEKIVSETSRVSPSTKGGDKESLSHEKDGLEEKKEQLKDDISQFIGSDLVFLLMGNLSSKLNEQLTDEKKKLEFDGKQQAIKPKIPSILNKLFSGEESKPPLQTGQETFYTNKLTDILNNILVEDKNESEKIDIIHGLSQEESNDVMSKIRNLTVSIEPVKKIVRELNKVEAQLAKLNKESVDLTDPAVLELFEKKGRFEQEKKQLEKEIEDLEVEIDTCEYNLTSLKREITSRENEVKFTPEKEQQKEYIEQIIKTIDHFSDEFRSTRVDRLEELSYEMWNKLAHKKDMVNKVEISKKDFSIRLKNIQGQTLDKTKLSAGEKEILALSLIWALGKLTKLDLPVIIDTPLGRLDRQHRESIAQNYFSHVSKQVFLLSTNEEIIRQEYEAVKDFLSKKYIIEHDSSSQNSKIKEGYFT